MTNKIFKPGLKAFFKRFPLHFQIITGMIAGVVFGFVAVKLSWDNFTINWVKPWGTIFIKSLQLIAVPLVIFSLVSGVASIKNIGELSKIGLRTILIYLGTTITAVSIGLLAVNLFQPWMGFDQNSKSELLASGTDSLVNAQSQDGTLQFLVDMVPHNILEAASNNGNMLQVIVFSVLFGIALVMVPKEKSKIVIHFFEGMNEVVLKMVHIIMFLAPLGTFALLSSLIVELADGELQNIYSLLFVMGKYALTVVFGLVLLAYGFYPLLILLFSKVKLKKFFKAIIPAQTLAFSTSSSAATLPMTIKCANENLKVNQEVSSFVLPLGATINMDGTSCYQAVAAVFIANVLGYDLDFVQQLSIVLTATLASIGSAAVPGAGMVMLAIVLSQIGVPIEGIAIILGVDRILDMCRTVVNVTGDLTVTVLVDSLMGKKGMNKH